MYHLLASCVRLFLYARLYADHATTRLDCPLLLQCLAKLDSEEGPPMFCSGGNDNKLCIWKSGTQQTQLLGCIERQEDESTALIHGSPT